ncbi:MAG: acetyl-CoA acetyltransferase [Chloroflexi bacterium]|nr:acetyl-CoA acetyltransferase [Chloroflexota bacterium]
MNGKVAIVGMGCSVAGVRSQCSQEDLLVEAGVAAIDAAGITSADIEASWFGCTSVSANHALLNFSLKLGYTAMTKVSNAGATGADALRAAYVAVASGAYDIVLAAGVEKPTDGGYSDFAEGDPLSMGSSAVGADAVVGEFRPPVHSALYLTRYANAFAVPPERLRSALTKLVTRSRRAGARNPKAGFRTPVREDEVTSSPLSVAPLTVLDCSQALDGAAAAIVCSVATAKRLRRRYIVVEGLGVASGGLEGRVKQSYDYTSIPETRIAAERAYAMAGITDPAQEIGHAQIFDLTTAAELLAYEDLGLAPRGKAVEAVLNGDFEPEGRIPTNTDGGLLSNGYQAGAAGLRQLYEAYLQLTDRAGERQIPDLRRSVVHTVGGAVGSFTALVQVVGRPQ